MFDKDRAISEIERYIKYVDESRIQPDEGLVACGLKPDEYAKYPPNTPGIHPYWDAEIGEIECCNILLNYFKDGITEFQTNLPKDYLKKKLAMLYNMILSPQFDSFMAAECGRGIDILLALCIRNDWKWLLGYDKVDAYESRLHGFFKDSRIKFFHMQSCHFDPMLLCGHSNILMTATYAHPVVLRVFHNWSCIGRIIKEGMIVRGTGKWPQASFWKEFKPEEQFTDEYFRSLKEKMNEQGVINI